MSRFTLGVGEAGGVSIDLPTLIDTRMLVQAQSGAGKSWMLRRVLEQTHGQVQQLVLDPEGEFATLREKEMHEAAARGIVCNHETEMVGLRAQIAQLQDESSRTAERLMADADALRNARLTLDQLAVSAEAAAADIGEHIDAPARRNRADNITTISTTPRVNRRAAHHSRALQPPAPSTNGHHADAGLDGITGGAMRMLERLAERWPETWTRAQLATMANVKKSGGTFGTYLGRLKQRGLIDEDAGRVAISDAGLALMGGPPAQPQSHDELVESWRSKLTGHPWTEANTYIRRDTGARQCRRCIEMRMERHKCSGKRGSA